MSTDQPTKVFLDAVPVTAIAKHPDNPRHDVGDVTDLATSIKDHGVLEPLVVVPFDALPDDAATGPRRKSIEWALIAGHRRLAAAREAKVKTVPVIARHDLTTREDQVAAMVIENQHRADLSPIEEGEAYQLLLDITPKATQAQVAAAVGMPKRRVSERLRLTKLGDTAKTAIHDGQLSLTDALEVLAIEARYPDLAEKVSAAAGTPNFRYELTRAKQDADVLDRYDRWRAKAKELGTEILAKAPGYQDGQPRRIGAATHGISVPDDEQSDDLAVGEAHASCPSAAVWIPGKASASYELSWYCTAFYEYHVPSEEERRAERAEQDAESQRRQAAREQERLAALTDKERAAEEQARAEAEAAKLAKQERVDALRAAQATRWDHFRAVINTGDRDLARWALNDLITRPVEDYTDYTSTACTNLLGLPDDLTADELLVSTRKSLQGLTLEQFAIFHWIAERQTEDEWLILEPWQHRVDPDPDYIAALTDHIGYQWSTVERNEFNLDQNGYVRTDDVEGGDAK